MQDITQWKRLAGMSAEQGNIRQAVYCYTQVVATSDNHERQSIKMGKKYKKNNIKQFCHSWAHDQSHAGAQQRILPPPHPTHPSQGLFDLPKPSPTLSDPTHPSQAPLTPCRC
jgi:hypothetical protein